MTNNIFEPLQLAGGSHKAGSGMGCAMNVISWENGDTEITDFPACSDDFLSLLVQSYNDSLADDHTRLLSPEYSVMVLELGHMTVGTGYHKLSDDQLVNLYVDLASFPYRKYFDPRMEPYMKQIEYSVRSAYMWQGNVHYAAMSAAADTNNLLSTMTRPMRYDFIKMIIEEFQKKANIVPVEVPVEKTNEAVAKMREVCPV